LIALFCSAAIKHTWNNADPHVLKWKLQLMQSIKNASNTMGSCTPLLETAKQTEPQS
jgi:hypothetical protein